MSSRRQPPLPTYVHSGARHWLPDNSQLRDRVGHHLETLEEVIGSLRREVAESREEIALLVEDRERLRRLVTRAEQVQAGQLESESRLLESRHQLEREEHARQAAQEHTEALRRRCGELEQALAAERTVRRSAEQEVAYLQEQVRQLTEIVDLLARDSAR